MPHSDVHKQKRRKNYILLAIIFGFCLIVFIMTMVKMAHSSGVPDKYRNERIEHQEEVDRLAKEYEEKAETHQQEIEDAGYEWWYGENKSDQAKEVEAARKGIQLDWESDEGYAERMKTFEEKSEDDDDDNDGENEHHSDD